MRWLPQETESFSVEPSNQLLCEVAKVRTMYFVIVDRPAPDDIAVCVDDCSKVRYARDLHLVLIGNPVTAYWSDWNLCQQVTVRVE